MWDSVTLHVIDEGKLKNITVLASQALQVTVDRYRGIRYYWIEPSPVFQLSMALFHDDTALELEQI
jgi:hypothetical protein